MQRSIQNKALMRRENKHSLSGEVITRMHGSALRCVRSDYLSLCNNGKFDPL